MSKTFTFVCTNQRELDAACEKQRNDASVRIEIRSDPSSRVVAWESSSVEAWGSSRVVARGSSRVVARGSSSVEAWESSRVVAWGSSRVVAWGSSRVVARGSSSVEAWESSRVEAWESSRVVAWGSSRVVARGSSSVVARESSRVEASARVAIHRMSSRARIKGGVVIDCTEPITTIGDALDEWLITPKHGRITVYKAVNDKLESERGFLYPIGTTVKCADWDASTKCGGGLHFSPSPATAKKYFPQATRFLECSVLVKDAALCGVDVFPDKLKAKAAKVIREVDVWGDALNVNEVKR